MKILFAVNNDNVSEAIAKKYQKEYREILSYKNVYYFNAILRELQRDKSYSRIVISEDLEPFANNNYDSIDKFLFEKYEGIANEAKTINNEKIDIILICADRRKKTDNMLAKIYKYDIYNAIIGQDRSIDTICRLIYQPRDKESAKQYYGIHESELGDSDSENSVSEAEVENIRAHYARIGKNEDKYVESFNNIVAQYTDKQLKIIIKYLPMNVKAVLEERSPKYQQLVMDMPRGDLNESKKTRDYKQQLYKTNEIKRNKEISVSDNEDPIIKQFTKKERIGSVVIPTEMKTENIQKIEIPQIRKPEIQTMQNTQRYTRGQKTDVNKISLYGEPEENIEEPEEKSIKQEENIVEQEAFISEPEENIFEQETFISEPEEKINESLEVEGIQNMEENVQEPKRGRGRPRKNPIPDETELENKPKRGRGRPRKTPIPEVIVPEITGQPVEENIDLFSMANERKIEQEENNQNPFAEEKPAIEKEEEGLDLFNIDENEKEPEEDDDAEEEVDLFNMNSIDESEDEPEEINSLNERPIERPMFNNNAEVREAPVMNRVNMNAQTENEDIFMPRPSNTSMNTSFSNTIASDTKVVAFVGTTKNGTSFVVNNTAEMLASMGINTAVLDLTKSKNAYYIYTNNEESLRTIARNCVQSLENGKADGIRVNNNLTIYAEIPDEQREHNIDAVLSTLQNNYSAILIDTDFETDFEVFRRVQEIYLVQTMDVLTIQPLTAFLRNLKSNGVLDPEKLRIVVNKSEKIRSLSLKTLIAGMSCYNAPNMTYMTELFNRDRIKYCEIPFEEQNYVKYLESLVNCKITLNGYTKQLLESLKELAGMVYPLIRKTIIFING